MHRLQNKSLTRAACCRLDVGALFGQYVGESEERTRQALQLAEVLAPVVLWLDEIDKAFHGVGAGGDNGVSARVFGHFLTWLSEKQDSVFVAATANDFRSLLERFPEFGRKGRFDEIFWVGLPDEVGRREIFEIYLRKLVKRGYLQIDGDALVRLATKNNKDLPHDEDLLSRLCFLLAQNAVSSQMTGADIEYAVSEALYAAYDTARDVGGGGDLTPDLVMEAVERIHNRAQYYSMLEPTGGCINLRAGRAASLKLSVPFCVHCLCG